MGHFKHVAPTYRGSTTLNFLVLQLCFMLRTLWIQNPAHVKQCNLQEAKFFCSRPSNWLYMRSRHKQVFFLGQRIFCILQIYKPSFKRLGSYEFCRILLSRNSCLVPNSGSMPKWVPPSRLPTGWIMLSARKGSWATGHCCAHGNNLYGYQGQVQMYGIEDTHIQSTYIQITYIAS